MVFEQSLTVRKLNMAAQRDRDPYEFSNHDSLPPVPRDALAALLKKWDANDTESTVSDLFAPDGLLIFGSEFKGRAAIKQSRGAMIHPEKGPILKCSHFFETGFVTGDGLGVDGKWEILGIADVRYDLLGGEVAWTRAASRCRVVKTNQGEWLADRYEVYMDGSKLFDAMGRIPKQ
jgi:hypothetical protein